MPAECQHRFTDASFPRTAKAPGAAATNWPIAQDHVTHEGVIRVRAQCRTISSATTACAIMLVTATGTAHADVLELSGDWWRAPATATRHTTLVCSFDSAQSSDAEFARGSTSSGGFGMAADVAGVHGSGTKVAQLGGHLHYLGGSNFQAAHGTVRFAVKGDVWAAAGPQWLFDARGKDRIGVLREPGTLSLVVCPSTRIDGFISRLDLPVGEVSTDAWHQVVASWDRAAATGWIALDGNGVSGPMAFSTDLRPAMAVYLGGGAVSRTGGIAPVGTALDDFVLYDLALPMLQAQPTPLPQADAEYLPLVEAGVRQTMDYMASLQRWGGWQTLYTWPTLLGSAAQGREYVDFDDYIDNDKGNGSCPLAAKFLWAYQTLGDYRYLGVALRTGEFILAAQAPEGYWVHGYRMTVNGITPVTSSRNIKLQDQDQAHPMLLLTCLHRVTGDERYLEALKKAGEFYLRAQNPNGSWSHHYDMEDGVGKNAIGLPGGGELNDGATNDAIQMMALMYHVTGERKYIEAMKRVGDWLLQAQGDTVPLWSDQYDAENNPVWARAFEPPSYGVTATTLACQALREMYRFTGDERYVDGIRRANDWIVANLPDGQMSTFIDPESGRAIAAWDRKIYYLDDPKSIEYLDTVPTSSSYRRTSNVGGTVARLLEQALAGPPERGVLTAEAAMAALEGKRTSAQGAMDSRNEVGVWTVPIVADYIGSIGEGFASSIPRASLMIAYVETARIAMGELPPRYPGSNDVLHLAYPFEDWYEVGQ